jgi:hypothetical protein
MTNLTKRSYVDLVKEAWSDGLTYEKTNNDGSITKCSANGEKVAVAALLTAGLVFGLKMIVNYLSSAN